MQQAKAGHDFSILHSWDSNPIKGKRHVIIVRNLLNFEVGAFGVCFVILGETE